MTKKNQDLVQKLQKKDDEIRLQKNQLLNAKQLFGEKVTQLRKEFNDKIVEYGKHIYPNSLNKEKVLFEDSFVKSKATLKNDSLADSILRMSHLSQSKIAGRQDLS